jgi:hypothetical protein
MNLASLSRLCASLGSALSTYELKAYRARSSISIMLNWSVSRSTIVIFAFASWPGCAVLMFMSVFVKNKTVGIRRKVDIDFWYNASDNVLEVVIVQKEIVAQRDGSSSSARKQDGRNQKN